MEAHRIPGLTLSVLLLSMFLLSVDVLAQSGRRGLFGDWQVKMDFNGRQFESILSFSRDAKGKRTGQLVSFSRVSELKDITYEGGKLSFVQSRQSRDGETINSKFTVPSVSSLVTTEAMLTRSSESLPVMSRSSPTRS